MARYGWYESFRCDDPACACNDASGLLDTPHYRKAEEADASAEQAKINGPKIGTWKPVGPNQGVLEESVKLFLRGIGEDPTRDGLQDTPKRIAKSWIECLSGYEEHPEDVVTSFDNDGDYHGPVILKGAELYSFCEHHGFPFLGELDVAYQPIDKIVGLSKLVRVARVFAKRLQVQERLTQRIADALENLLEPEWVVVRYRAEHFCMRIRGVRVKESTTTTIAGHGNYPKDIFSQ